MLATADLFGASLPTTVDPLFMQIPSSFKDEEDLLIDPFFDDEGMSSVFVPDLSPLLPTADSIATSRDPIHRAHTAADASTGDDYVPSEDDDEEEPAPKKSKPTRARRGTRTPEERAQAVLEKNRRAQKRFRERSKQRAKDMETTLSTLTEQVARLTTENSTMAARTAMLEKVVTLRDEQIQQLQQEQRIYGFGAPQLPACDGARCMPKELQLMSTGAGRDAPKTARAYDDVYAEYKTIVADMIPVLAEHDLTFDAATRRAAVQRLATLALDMGGLCMAEAMRGPGNMAKLMAEDGSSGVGTVGCEDEAFWAALAGKLELSPQQVKEVERLRAVFVAKQQGLVAERRQLGEDLRAATGADVQGGGLRALAGDVVRMHAASAALADNLSQQHAAAMDFAGILLKKTLKPLALARVLTTCYPAFPDALRLATAIVQQQQ